MGVRQLLLPAKRVDPDTVQVMASGRLAAGWLAGCQDPRIVLALPPHLPSCLSAHWAGWLSGSARWQLHDGLLGCTCHHKGPTLCHAISHEGLGLPGMMVYCLGESTICDLKIVTLLGSLNSSCGAASRHLLARGATVWQALPPRRS